ncbi:nicotinamide riboside transporter PnuC [Gracilimonas mengyeensis]|uniref:Nicotinamide riboside transporter PnuC n=1 Tax=Gracilimonas mengyeensis TaxID=1302730 RepID=A0A521EM80_9BACT|nr:nicotinamide riboside transporter PnuC [Gracilimonas mengyeensis]SMO85027.1 nicotinamide mononucleotide transporter [Gracilimonas mengyeensis]
MEYVLNGIIEGIIRTTALEWIAVITGLMSVWFSMKENILVYPTGIVSVLIYVYLAFQYKLYADMGVNFYYFVMSVYGWYYWTQTDEENLNQKPVTTNSRQENLISAALLFGSFGILYFVLSNFTDSDVAFWDATTTSFAIVGMWLMARKTLESWVAWIITDLISIPLYFYKGLVLTSFQFLVFTGLAFAGYFAWKKSLQNKEENTAASAQPV